MLLDFSSDFRSDYLERTLLRFSSYFLVPGFGSSALLSSNAIILYSLLNLFPG